MNLCSSRVLVPGPTGSRRVCLLFLLFAVTLPHGSARAEDSADLVTGPVALLADEPNAIEVGVGAFDVAREKHELSRGTTAVFGIDLRIGRKLWYAGPIFGVLANHQGAVFGYGGLYFDLSHNLRRRWRFSPFFTAGGYRQGDSKPLTGGTIAFQIGATLSYELDDRSRLGLSFTHISNAFIYDSNPGAESVLLTYAVAFDAPFGSTLR